MVHAQKPDFVFRRNGRVHLNQQGASVQSTTGSRGIRISGSNAGYIMFEGSVKSTGYPLHSPVSPSLPLPCVTVCHHISTGVYLCPSVLHNITQTVSHTKQVDDTRRKSFSFRALQSYVQLVRPSSSAKYEVCCHDPLAFIFCSSGFVLKGSQP